MRALIERFQPWQRRQRPDLHSLWVVHEFDRKDKHRVITPVAMAPQQIETNVTLRYVDEATARTALPPVFAAKDSPLENNAEFLTVYTPSAPVEVKMHHGITLGIGISHEGITGGVTGTLGNLYKDVRGVVEEFLDCLT